MFVRKLKLNLIKEFCIFKILPGDYFYTGNIDKH